MYVLHSKPKFHLIVSCVAFLVGSDTVAGYNGILYRANVVDAQIQEAHIATKEDGTKDAIEKLAISIASLRDLGDEIHRLGTGRTVDRIRIRCEQRVATGWLRTWKLFSELTLDASNARDNKLRLRLLSTNVNGSMIFNDLLSIYAGLEERTEKFRQAIDRDPYARREWNLPAELKDPLRVRLWKKVGLVLMLDELRGPTSETSESDNASIFLNGYTIPDSRTLVGTADEQPTLDEKSEMLSLWRLINLQLDTWNDWSVDLDSDLPTSTGLTELANWLARISSNEDVYAFGAPTQLDRTYLQLCAERLSKFLRFRERASDPNELQRIVNDLADDRHSVDSKGPIAVVPGLVLAATPLPSSDEYLVDAALWLRYIVMLSYQSEGGLSLVGYGDQSLDKYWKHHKLPQNTFLINEPTSKRGPTVFRWNAWPNEGHIANLLGDMTSSAVSYLTFQNEIAEATSHRLQKRYSEQLEDALNELCTAIRHPLWRHNSNDFMTDSNGHITDRFVIQQLKQYPSRVWPRSATRSEQQRLAVDLSSLTQRLNSAIRLQRLMLKDLEEGGGLESYSVSSSLGALTSLPQSHPARTPTRTFASHITRIRTLSTHLKRDIEDRDVARRLVRAYQLSFQEAEIAQLEYEAATFALQAAEQATAMSRIYEHISELDVQIRRLNKEWANLAEQGHAANEKANGIRLALSIRSRDLAAAQVEALVSAMKRSEAIIQSSTQSLRDTQQILLQRADQIEDEKRKSFIIGIVKSAVRIVGAALSPFTGGASIAISEAVVQTINLIQNAESMEWGNLEAIVGNVGELAGKGVKISNNVIQVAGSEQLKKDWTSLQASFRNTEQAIAGVGDQARELLQGINGLSELTNTVNAAASGLPISYANRTLHVDLRSLRKIHIKDRGLANALKGVLDSGGVFVNNLEQRVRRIGQLPLLDDEALQVELKTAVDECVAVAPPDVILRFEEIGRTLTEPQRLVEESKLQLKKWIESAGQEKQKLLARILGGGMIIMISDDGAIVAVERPVEKELESIRNRLESIVRDGMVKAIGDIVKTIQSKRHNLNAQIEKTEQARDEAELRRIANETVPQIIVELAGDKERGVRGELDKLSDKLAQAKGVLDDKQLEVDAAGFENIAARFFADAAKVKLEEAEVAVQKALNYTRVRQLQLERDKTLLDKHKLLVKSTRKQCAIANLLLRQAFIDCLDRGINPTSSEEEILQLQIGYFEQRRGISLAGAMFRGRNASEIAQSNLVREMAEEFVGALQWMNLLCINSDGEPDEHPRTSAEWYMALVNHLALERSLTEDNRTFEAWVTVLERQVENNASRLSDIQAFTIEYAELNLEYFDENAQAVADPYLSLIDEHRRKQAIGRIEFRVGHELGDIAPQISRDDLFVVARKIRSVRSAMSTCPVGSLFYKIVPPSNSRSFIRRPTAKILPKTRDEKVLSTPDQAAWIEEVSNDVLPWPRDPRIVGFYGDWQIYLFDARLSNKKVERRDVVDSYRDQLKLDVWIPILRVSCN